MQMKFLENKARRLFDDGCFTLVLSDGSRVITSTERGIKPLMNLYGGEYSDFDAADKVIGKAAAFMYVHIGVSNVYAEVISERALEVFNRYGINTEYKTLVPAIENRTKTGFCPMEAAVWDIDDPDEALIAINNKLAELSKLS